MRSKKITLQIPWRLYEVYEKHAPEVGYSNVNQLLAFSPIHSLLVRRFHHITAAIAQADADMQDRVIERIIDDYENGHIRAGSLLDHLLEDVINQFNIPVKRSDVLAYLMAHGVRKRPPSKRP